MSILFKEILGKRDYLTYYYAVQTLSDSDYEDFTITSEGRHKLPVQNTKSAMFKYNYLGKSYTIYGVSADIEFLIIPPNMECGKFYNTINQLKNLETLLVIKPSKKETFDVLRNLPFFSLKKIIIEQIESTDVKYLDNLPLGLEKVIFIHILDKYEKTKSIFENMKMPFDCSIQHLVKKNIDSTVVYDYNELKKS